MRQCQECKRKFPNHIIQPMVSSEFDPPSYERSLCPICALKLVNHMHGLPEGTAFRGIKANAIHTEAVAYLKEKGEKTNG